MESVQQYPEIFINGETEDSLKKGAAKIVNLIKPSWKKDDFQYKIFTDGISNKLIGVYIGNVKADMVLVRVYGAKTELIIDRTAEVRNMTVLNQVGCGCQLYAQFGNGLAYEFLPGETLSISSAKSASIYPAVASAMAKMHKLVDLGPEVPREPCMWKKLHMFLEQYPEEDEFPDKQRLDESNISRQRLTAEVLLLEKKLKASCKSPIVFTHNDLLLANIVINHDEKNSDGSSKVSFIDYEYGDYNYQECDIANHFDEMAGVENMDFLRDYPKKEFQLEWIRAYLKEYDGCEPDENRLMDFYNNVAQFSLCYHLMWGLWGLVQAKISKIEFDFVAFALARLGEYFRAKDERLALKIDGKF